MADAASVSALELQIATDLSKKSALESNDKTAINENQQTKLNEHKVKQRIEAELYIREHPELSTMMSLFVRETLMKKPTNIKEFAADYFTDEDLSVRVKESMVVKPK